MAKFNQTVTRKTVNKCGNIAYTMQDDEKLMSMVLTTMFNEKKYYGDNSNELVRLAEISDMDFVSRLAVYARKEMNLRSVSHVLACVVARYGRGAYTRRTVHGVVNRPDDITEILACYKTVYGKPFPNALKRQLAEEMGRFNEFQFAKYNGGKKEFTFKDVLKICHPTPKTAKSDVIFGKILNDTLETPYTWEVELSARGNKPEVWEELIDSGKMGYMATLRNLRNIINSGASNLDKALRFIANKDAVKKSKQLPFRFYSAYRELPACSTKVYDALEDAIEASISNMEQIPGSTLIALDTSGSMSGSVSAKSKMTCCGLASVLASCLTKLCDDCEVVTFDSTLKHKNVSHRGGILYQADHFNTPGGATYMRLPFEYIIRERKKFDRVVVISDNMCNDSFWCGGLKSCMSLIEKYRREVNPALWVHGIDLQGYGTQNFIGARTSVIAGWSERIFEFINLNEQGMGTMVQKIKNYDI